MEKKALLFGVCLFIHFIGASSNAQNLSQNITRDSIKQILEKSSESLYDLDDPDHNQSVHYLELAEDLVNDIDDPYLKILVNRYRIGFQLEITDTLVIKDYLQKNLSLILGVGDMRELGLYYEQVGVLKSARSKVEEEYEAYTTAYKLLEKYGEKKDLIDANYNLSLINRRKKEWQKTIDYGLEALKIIEETNTKKDRRVNLYVYLAEAYFNLNQDEKAVAYFDKVEKDEFFNRKTYDVIGFYHGMKGQYYRKVGEFEKSALSYRESCINYYLHASKRTRAVSSSLALASKLNIKEEENKRIKIENQLKAEQLRNSKYIILVSVLLIVGLILMSIIQYRSSFYKTKINKLLNKNYRKLIEANHKVDKALEVKSEFLDSVTHELLTPLNTIKGTTFLLQKEKLTQEQINQIKLINISSDHLLNLINDVIHLNELENGELELKNEVFDLKTLLNNLIDSSIMMKNETNSIHREIDDQIPDILKGDVLKISQVFLNILDNSMKFTKNGNIYIDVSLVSKENNKVKVKFSIRDTGIGMSKEQTNKAFDAFHQGSVKINREYGGTGLGLSIVKKILKLKGSDIVLKSKKEEGTTVSFMVGFDLNVEEVKSNVPYKKEINEISEEINILLVEDNKVNQLITEKIISNYGFRCDSANDGEEAVAMVKKKKYSLVLMDIMMPRMDGFEATKFIKTFNTQLPIIALTAISEKLNKEKFNEVGIFTILSKPVNPELLYETIVNCCGSCV